MVLDYQENPDRPGTMVLQAENLEHLESMVDQINGLRLGNEEFSGETLCVPGIEFVDMLTEATCFPTTRMSFMDTVHCLGYEDLLATMIQVARRD
jgi:hypothetical protein